MVTPLELVALLSALTHDPAAALIPRKPQVDSTQTNQIINWE